jgi:hypothetical protein
MEGETAVKQMYGHETLGQGYIRLLILDPAAAFDDTIECHLETHELSPNLTYNALSYVWGDATDTKDITVAGQVWPVTVNLESALRHFRNRSEKCVLWVDALCINQANLAERSIQVQQMTWVYFRASRVLVWLGDSTEHTGRAIDALHFMARAIKEWNDSSTCYFCSEDQNLRNEFGDDIFERYVELVRSPWWSRLWTLQESLLNANPYFFRGSFTFDLNELYLLYYVSDSCKYWHPEIGSIVVTTSPTFEGKASLQLTRDNWQLCQPTGIQPYMALDKLLLYSRTRESTDPRDKLFGLGIFFSELLDWDLLDYSLSPSEVFTMVQLEIMDASRSLDILSAVTPNNMNQDRTWMVDWAYKWPDISHVYASLTRVSNISNCSAGGNKFTCPELITSKTLAFSGHIIDRIRVTGTEYNTDYHILTILRTWARELCLQLHGEDFTILLQTIFVSCYFKHAPPPHPFTPEFVSKVVERLQHLISSGIMEEPKCPNDPLHPLHYQVTFPIFLRRPFITERGYIGFAPASAQPRDLICVLCGGKALYVIREATDEGPLSDQEAAFSFPEFRGPRYKLVGDAYIEGLMQGEGMEMLDEAEAKEQTIMLI